jgi:hypothetical protein
MKEGRKRRRVMEDGQKGTQERKVGLRKETKESNIQTRGADEGE